MWAVDLEMNGSQRGLHSAKESDLPLDLEPTAEIERALSWVRTAQRITTADQEMDGSQRPNQNENEEQCWRASGTRPTAFSG